MGENVRFKNGHACRNARSSNARVLGPYLTILYALVDDVSVHLRTLVS